MDMFAELSELRGIIEPCCDFSISQTISEYEAASIKLSQICTCKYCKHQIGEAGEQNTTCIYRLGEFIIILAWQLSLISSDRAIQPLHDGLESLYRAWCHNFPPDHRHSEHVGSIAVLLAYLNATTVYQTAHYIFTGHMTGYHASQPDQMYRWKDLPPAIVSHGLCIFVDTFEQISDRPESCKFLNILPGTIEGQSGVRFDSIEDGTVSLHAEYQDEAPKEIKKYDTVVDRNDTPMHVKLLARETLRNLIVSLEISSPRGKVCVGPMYLKRAVLQSVGLIRCGGQNCEPLKAPLSSISTVEGEGYVYPKEDVEMRRRVVIRKLAGNVIARCLSVCECMQSERVKRMRQRDKRAGDSSPAENMEVAQLMRRDECLPCSIRAALKYRADIVYLTV